MRPYRHLLLPLALIAAPAQATRVCAWLDETLEPYEEDEEEAAEDAADAAADAADAAADAVDAAADATDEAVDAAESAAAAAAEAAADAAFSAGTIADDSEEAGLHNLKLWLEADGDVSFYFKMAGAGFVQDEGGSGHSPSSSTMVLSAGEPSSPWGFGMTFYPPGRIDLIAEIRAYPEDVFAEKDPPLLTTFTFRRKVPADEKTPPATLAQRQCQDVTFPPEKDR